MEREVCYFLKDNKIEDITLIGYSAGASVAYDALLEGRPVPEAARRFAKKQGRRMPIRLMTIGSGLYHMWSFAGADRSGVAERARLAEMRLDPGITGSGELEPDFPFWTDVFARLDFIAAGPLRAEIAGRSCLERDRDYETHRVINYDDLAHDHFGYFRNKDLVIPRIISVLFNDREWASDDYERAAREQKTALHPRRRAYSVLWLHFAKLLPVTALTIHGLGLWLIEGWREIVSAAGGALLPGYASGPFVETAQQLGIDARWVAFTLVLAIVSYVISRTLGSRWRPMVDDGERLGVRHAARSLSGLVTLFDVRAAWRRRKGIAALATSLAVIALAAAWLYVPAQVGDGAFTLRSEPPGPNAEIVAVTGTQIALSGAAKNVEHPGVLGLEWDGGYAQIGPIIRIEDGQTVRALILPDDDPSSLPPVGPVRIDSFAFSGDPLTARGVPFRRVTYDAPLGPQAAYVAGDQHSTWAILVHGKGAGRGEGYRILPTLVELNLTAMLITYRNDPESIPEVDGRYEYGATEWRDLEAAVAYARSNGARDIVLYGYSMGGAIVASFLQRSDLAQHVRAVVLDAPMLDFRPAAELGLKEKPVVRLFASQLAWISGKRLGIDWEELNYLDRAERFASPMLVFHGAADDIVPIETSRRLRRLRPDLVELVEVAGAGHVRSWNVDPAAYEQRVRAFLAKHVVE